MLLFGQAGSFSSEILLNYNTFTGVVQKELFIAYSMKTIKVEHLQLLACDLDEWKRKGREKLNWTSDIDALN